MPLRISPARLAILALVIIRIVNRLLNRRPPLPADLPTIQKIAAKAWHIALYGSMLALLIVGWSMLCADLRQLHTVLAYLFFLTIVVHIAAALFHGLIRRDGVLGSMASWRLKK